MRKLIVLAVFAMALVAAPAFASVQNVKISGAVNSTYIMRDDFDFGATVVSNLEQSDFITQTTLQVDADLSDNVSATVGLINEGAWGVDASGRGEIDLYLAFVKLREMLYSPLTVVIGRQSFAYGNSFIMDSAGTNNQAPGNSGIQHIASDLTSQTTLDAVRLMFDYNPLNIELLFSKINSNSTGALNADQDDIDLFGINSGYELGDSMGTKIETYFFAKIDHSTEPGNANAATESDTIYLPGLRASASVFEGLNVQAEAAWQRGNKVTTTATAIDAIPRDAFAAQFISSYSIPVMEEYKPVAQYIFTHVSGDSNPGDRQNGGATTNSGTTWTAWDPFFENQAGGKIYNSIFDLTNLNIHEVSLQITPMEDVTVKGSWAGLWLDKDIDCAGATSFGNCANTTANFTLRNPGLSSNTVTVVDDENQVGYEIDVDTTYDYTEDVQFGLKLGWFVPGDVFASSDTPTLSFFKNDDVAKQALLNANVRF
jgi:hypothetical protein